MTDAYVNIVVDAGAVSAAADKVAEIDEVETVHVVTGTHDIVAQVASTTPTTSSPWSPTRFTPSRASRTR